jgi:hypothetical protein
MSPSHMLLRNVSYFQRSTWCYIPEDRKLGLISVSTPALAWKERENPTKVLFTTVQLSVDATYRRVNTTPQPIQIVLNIAFY